MTHSCGYDLEGLAKRRFSSFLVWEIAHWCEETRSKSYITPALTTMLWVVFIKKY